MEQPAGRRRLAMSPSEETTLIEGMVFLGVLVLLGLSLNLLIRLARLYARQRPTYTKPDPLFRNKDKHQNWSWDWIVVFRVQEADEVVSRYQEQYSLRRILERLNQGGLETKLYKSYNYDKIFCKIRCGFDRLKTQASAIDYPLLLKEQQVVDRMTRGYRDETNAAVWQGRVISDPRGQCPSYEYFEYIYGKYDKRDDLKDLYEEYPSSNSIFRGVDRLKLIMSIMEADVKDDGCSFKLRDLIAKGAVLAIFPLHDDLELHALQHQWLASFTMPWNQPLEAVKDYYGEKVGLYFMFLGHYAGWLLGAGTFGLFVFGMSQIQEPWALWGTLAMAVFMSLWTTFFLQDWQSKQATAKMEWGMNGFEELERERTGFEGTTIHSPIDGMPVQYFAPSEKSRRVLSSYFQICLCMLYVTTINAGVFYAHAYISRYPFQDSFAFSFFPKYYNLPLILTHLVLATVVTVTNQYFMPFAKYLNGAENHRTDTEYEDNLIAKVFVFQFANSYGSLFYITLVQGPIPEQIAFAEPWRTRRFTCKPFCFEDAGALLATIFVIRVVVNNAIEVILPYYRLRQRLAKHTKSAAGDDDEYDDPFDEARMRKRQISPAEEQFEKDDYDSISLFNDYAELVIQYGYATLFVSAFPLAPMFACANNIIEIRVDGWKLTQNTRRPWPSGAEDIGTWEDVLHLMSVIATVTNILMVTFLSPVFGERTLSEKILVFIGLEFFLLGIKLAIVVTGDAIPEDVQIQNERQAYYASKIIDNLQDKDADDVDAQDANLEEPPIAIMDPQIELLPESNKDS